MLIYHFCDFGLLQLSYLTVFGSEKILGYSFDQAEYIEIYADSISQTHHEFRTSEILSFEVISVCVAHTLCR